MLGLDRPPLSFPKWNRSFANISHRDITPIDHFRFRLFLPFAPTSTTNRNRKMIVFHDHHLQSNAHRWFIGNVTSAKLQIINCLEQKRTVWSSLFDGQRARQRSKESTKERRLTEHCSVNRQLIFLLEVRCDFHECSHGNSSFWPDSFGAFRMDSLAKLQRIKLSELTQLTNRLLRVSSSPIRKRPNKKRELIIFRKSESLWIACHCNL